MLERLGFTVLICALCGMLFLLLRSHQRRRVNALKPLSSTGQANLIVVVSSHCAICPTQKNVVRQLSDIYPSSLLRVITIDAETQAAQARELSVMTVPTTLLQAPDGTIVNINNGYIALAPLARQIDKLIARRE